MFVPHLQLSEVEGHCLSDDICYVELQARQGMMDCLMTEVEGVRLSASTSPTRSKRDVEAYVYFQPTLRWPLSTSYAIHPSMTGKWPLFKDNGVFSRISWLFMN